MRGLRLGLGLNRNNGVFSPLSLSPVMWLDATDVSTLTVTATTPIPNPDDTVKRLNLANNVSIPRTALSTSDHVINTVSRHTVATSAGWSNIRLHYANWHTSTTMVDDKYTLGTATATLTITASIQTSDGTLYPCTGSLVLAGGEDGYLSIPNIELSAGETFHVLTHAEKPSGVTSTYPMNMKIKGNRAFDTGARTGTDSGVNVATTGIPYGATATATVVGNNITGLSLTAGGSGYVQNASVIARETQSNGIMAVKEIGTATVSGGAVTGISLTDGTPPTGVSAWVTPSISIAFGGTIISSNYYNWVEGFSPSMITGIPDTPVRSILGVGDSIMSGHSGTVFGDEYSNVGVFEVGISNDYPFVNMGCSGYRAFDFVDNGTNFTDKVYAFYTPYVTDAVVELGINDEAWLYSLSKDVEDLESWLQSIYTDLNAAQIIVNFSTISPRTNSTDGWTTTANQTDYTWGSGSVSAKDTAAYINASIVAGTIISDNNYIDLAGLEADTVDVWKWRVSDSLKTTDGLHPMDLLSTGMNGVAIAAINSTFQAYFDYLGIVGGSVSQWDDKSGNGNDVVQATSAEQPFYTAYQLDFDLVDDNLEMTVPVGGWAGTMVYGFKQGSYAVEVSYTAGTHQIGQYLPDDELVGIALYSKTLTDGQKSQLIRFMESKGAGSIDGWSTVTSFLSAWRENNLTSFPALDLSAGTTFQAAWYGNSLTSFPAIDLSNATVFTTAWYGNNLTSFPEIDMSSATNVSYAWRGNSLTSFPAIDLSSCTSFIEAWRYNSLTSFPALDLSAGTTFQAAWYGNSLTSFPAIDLSSGTNFQNAWYGNNLTSFPAIDLSSGTNFQNAWYNNDLTSFPANMFDSLSSPVASCFVNAFAGTNVINAAGMENILVSIDTSGASAPASGVDITISSNGDTLTSATNTAITSLKAKGWTITIDGVPK